MIPSYLMEELLQKINNFVNDYRAEAHDEWYSQVSIACIKHDLDTNFRDKNSKTFLHYAVCYNYIDTIKYLVEECNLNVHELDQDGKVPLHYVCNKEIVEYLVMYGANINARDNYDHTPLHYAKLHGNIEVFKELLKLGATVNIARYLISRYEKDIIEIIECADHIYFNQQVNILPLIRVSEDTVEEKSLGYDEALKMIHARLNNLILHSGYPTKLQLQMKLPPDKEHNVVYNSKQPKITQDLQQIIDSIKLPNKRQIGEEIETYLAALLYNNSPERFYSVVPYSILKKDKLKVAAEQDSVYSRYKKEYPHYKTKNCFDYLVDEKNYDEILPILLSDDSSRKLLFNSIKKIALNQEDFNKFRLLYNKVTGLLNKLETVDPDLQLLYQIRKHQHNQVVECFAELKEKYILKQEECYRLEDEIRALQSKDSAISKGGKMQHSSRKNHNINYKSNSLHHMAAVSEEEGEGRNIKTIKNNI